MQNRTRGIETWNRLITVRREERGGDCLKEGEGISQRTCIKDSQTRTMMWGLTMKVGGGLAKGGEGRKIETIVTT